MENKTENRVTVIESNKEYIELKRPIQFDGKEVKDLTLDLYGLTGIDIEKAEIQFIANNPQMAAQTPLKEMSKGFLAIVAAMAAKKPVEFIRALSATDYANVTTRVQIFLIQGE